MPNFMKMIILVVILVVSGFEVTRTSSSADFHHSSRAWEIFAICLVIGILLLKPKRRR